MKNIKIEKGTQSFCEGHGTRYWKVQFRGLRRKVKHHIITFNNDLSRNKKYHCYVDYGGCIGDRSFETDNFKNAMFWMACRLKKYLN